MKIIAVGDVHGRDTWKKVAEKEPDFDMFVFIGDYFDSFTISPEKQQDNFMDILDFKTRNEDKVKLLVGNHDMHYLSWATQQCSGFNVGNLTRMCALLGQLVKTKRMQLCWQYENVMFSHAGISKTWLNSTGVFEDYSNFENEKGVDIMDDFLNDLFLKRPDLFEYNKLDTSGFGDHVSQSPLWIRPESLKTDVAGGVTQVVGHTTFDNVFAITEFEDLDTQPIILLDAPKSKEYLVIEEGEIKIRKWGEEKENTT